MKKQYFVTFSNPQDLMDVKMERQVWSEESKDVVFHAMKQGIKEGYEFSEDVFVVVRNEENSIISGGLFFMKNGLPVGYKLGYERFSDEEEILEDQPKTLDVTDIPSQKEGSVHTFGNPDIWQLICKAWNVEEGWMKSTKALTIKGANGGLLVQVTTQHREHIAESLVFVPSGWVKVYPDGRKEIFR